QRLLSEADWDAEAVRDDLRTEVLERLGEEAGILVVAETGLLKKGKKSAGVAPQYSGTAPQGAVRTARWGASSCMPAPRGQPSWIGSCSFQMSGCRTRCAAARRGCRRRWALPPTGRCHQRGVATKGALAQRMLARAFAAGVRAAWVVGDT